MRSPSRLVLAAALLVPLAVAGRALADDEPAARPVPASTSCTALANAPSPAAGTRDYCLHVPPGLQPGRPIPLVVYLHGCNETAADAEAASHWDRVADAHGFAVVYPQQTLTPNSSAPLADGNGLRCWNWFAPNDQERGSGEPAAIVDVVRRVESTLAVDPARVYVEGMSAGADMATILVATYPDVFAAVGVQAGCAYRTCGDGTGALTHAAQGPRARAVPELIVAGSADTLNNLAMASTGVTSALGADRLAGARLQPAPSVVTTGADQVPAPGGGDPCLRYPSWTCPGGVVGFHGSYPTTVSTWSDDRGCDLLQFWLVHGLEHAHPAADTKGPYTDPLGPDVTVASWDFFARHPMGGCPDDED